MASTAGGFYDHIRELYNDPDLSDVAIVLDNDEGDETLAPTKTFHGHRVILATMSDYFRSMLFGSFMEATKKEIRLPGVPYSTFMKLMHYVYFGWSDPVAESLEELAEFYTLARMLLLAEEMESRFESWLCGKVGEWEQNIWKIQSLAYECDLPLLKLKCNSHFCHIANECLSYSSFVELPLGAIRLIFYNDHMNCTRAELEKAVHAWIDHHIGEIDVDMVANLKRMASSYGVTCYDCKKISLYEDNDREQALDLISIPAECFEPMDSLLEYSFKSGLRILKCIRLEGIQICLKANRQFGPKLGRKKSQLELYFEVISSSTSYKRKLNVQYDFTQHSRKHVTIFFPAIDCCGRLRVEFNFRWNGTDVQPLLQNCGPVHGHDTFKTDSSYVTHVFCTHKELLYPLGRCRLCIMPFHPVNRRQSYSESEDGSEEEEGEEEEEEEDYFSESSSAEDTDDSDFED